MGVKDLWNILGPLCERRPIYELEGKTIAIDLSCWVVDSQTVTDNSVQPKMYLRNLYFRTAFLLMHGISPVFVLEGKAPVLKHDTIARRNDVRNGLQDRKRTRRGVRSQLNRILKECREMLGLMGLACVQGHGEAEAMCAYLNADGLVDGCISQDSDCFLYGARVVYRNFCMSAQGNRGGTGGAVDEYTAEKIERVLNLGRNKMVALALLCGCDYDDGLNGVGKEAAMKFFKLVEDEDVIQRIKSWKTDDSLDKKEAELLHSNLCSSCGHAGKAQRHARVGCTDCGTVVKCHDSFKEQRALILNEVTLRKRALAAVDFPNMELIEEFLVRKDPTPPRLDLRWKQPQLAKLIDFMERHLSWEARYAFDKIFPLVTRWQLSHLPGMSPEARAAVPDLFTPEAIKKIRNIRSVASYEIVWRNDHEIVERLKEYAEALDSDQGDEGTEKPFELTSIEPQDAVSSCYPQLVQEFEAARAAKARKRPAKSRAKKIQDEGTEEPAGPGKNAKKNAKRTTNRKKKGQSTENERIPESIGRPESLEESFEKLAITPKRSKRGTGAIKNPVHLNNQEATPIKRGPQIDRVLQLEHGSRKLDNTLEKMFNELSPDDFLSETEEDLNMTEIIESICSKRAFRFEPESLLNGKEPCTENVFERTFSEEKNIEGAENVGIPGGSGNVENVGTGEIEGAAADETFDEFAVINESYVPICQRIENNRREKQRRAEHRFSIGIDDLMNDTA